VAAGVMEGVSARGSGPRAHALAVLEFDEVLRLVAAGAVSEDGARRVLALQPFPDLNTARRELAAVDEVRRVLVSEEGWELGAIPPVRAALHRLGIEGAVLEPAELLACAEILRTARRAGRDLGGRLEAGGVADADLARLWSDRDLEARVGGSFDESGEVSDGASPELRHLRRQLLDLRGRLVDRLEEVARALPERIRVPDGSVTLRGGRYCIPVRREGKNLVGGLVHDASGSQQTLFIEPPAAIEPMNEIRELEIAVRREIDRILRALSDALRAHADELTETFEALGELDALRARALAAVRLEGSLPELVEPGVSLRIREGRHPLLAAGAVGPVPFDLTLSEDERVLLISGPNAGGKTVLLKSVGLIVVLARSGLIPPVGPGTRIPFLGGPFAIIGDEQSIEASLSTFGAQAQHLATILEAGGPTDLVLIDEIGSATDPAEGGALAAASLSKLATQVRLTVATTHLGDLKGLAEERSGTVNASLQFDGERLQPTYRLEKDRPGRSYALEIAARLGVPETVLADARSRLEDDHQSLDGLLARLEVERRAAEEARREIESVRADLAERQADVARRGRELSARARVLDEEAEAALESRLREARSEIETAIRKLEETYASDGDDASRREARRAARDTAERGLREAKERRVHTEARPAPGTGVDASFIGTAVRWESSGKRGRLVEVRADRGLVEVDGVRLSVPIDELTPMEAAGSRARTVPGGGPPDRRPDFEVRSEIDLRGLRADEVEGALIPALDAAVVAALPRLRIVHGKGTGAVRRIVHGLLDRDPRVPGYRSGDPREGGTGVTMVELE